MKKYKLFKEENDEIRISFPREGVKIGADGLVLVLEHYNQGLALLKILRDNKCYVGAEMDTNEEDEVYISLERRVSYQDNYCYFQEVGDDIHLMYHTFNFEYVEE